ncbi:tetratricopeptide repeat protein [Xylophilus sp. GW821-FHT01B05]
MSTPPSTLDEFNRQLQSIEQLIAKKDLRPAAERLNKLGRTAPQHPAVYILGMRLGEAAGNPKAALQAARRAVECAPGWPIAVIELAACLARQNQWEEALVAAQKAIDRAPDDLPILSRAIDIATHARNSAVALPWLQKAATLAPNNVPLQRLLARALTDAGQIEEALRILDAAVDATPSDSDVLAERMSTAFRLGHSERAKQDATRLVELAPDNEVYRFWLQKLHGEVPSTQPNAMVQDLFNNYAPSFDMHLVQGLKYDTPRQVAEWIRGRYPTLELNVLDLGCGTGLLGAFLGRINGALIGVDLSPKMVEQAARHDVYDRFHTVNLLDALRETPDALYHVITACDVFIHVGDLSTAIPNALRVLRPDGNLIFTCEEADESGPDLVLRDSIRYAHKVSAIQALCKNSGFDDVAIEFADLRLERGAPIRGFRVIAHKPA